MARRRWWVLAVWVAIVLVMGYFSAGTPRLLSPAGFTTDTQADRAAGLLRTHFPQRRGPVVYVVLQSPQTPVTDPAFQAQLVAWRADLERLSTGTDAQIPPPIPGRDGRTAALVLDSNATPDHFVELARHAKAIHHPGPAVAYLGGVGPVYDTFISDSEADLQNSERASAPLAVGLLLLVFGGLVAAGLPVLTGLATVTAAVALLGLAAHFHEVSVFALNISSVLGVGLGIDYSLLVVNRFREELRQGRGVEDAVGATVSTAGVATLISGGTVMIGFGALLISHLNILWSMGLGGFVVVCVSVLASLTLIPALLAAFGPRVDRLALPFTRGRDTGPFWSRLANAVMGRPLAFIGLALALILVLAAPARSLHLGVVGAESLPPDDPSFIADRLAREQLGFSTYSPVLVVARGVTTPELAAQVEGELRKVAGAQPVRGPASVAAELQPLFYNPPYAVYEADQPAGDNDDATHRFLDHIRGARWPAGVVVLLGGEAPAYQDFLGLLLGDFPKVFGLVVGLTLVLLGLSFRSFVLPVKAVLMNLLSVTAAMGVLTWIFQQGHLSSWLNFRAVGFVEATVPVIIFAGLFGLSMDYEVFLLSRIREEYRRGLDNAQAVARGLERTGQIITSAALILVVVVSTLDLSHLTINKSLGVTFAVAIFLDATLIRLVLVPAMMRLLGSWNWWPALR